MGTTRTEVRWDAGREGSANDRLKAGWRSRFWGSLLVAVGLHFGVFQLWPQMAVAVPVKAQTVLDVVPGVPDTEIPDKPEPPPQPAHPVVGDVPLETVPEFSTRWDEAPPQGPPPPEAAEEEGAGDAPGFVKVEVAPRLTNGDEVARLLEAEYPPLLRDAGIEGAVRVWFRLDAAGKVVETRVDESSGHPSLDDAALRVADRMEFTPAMNRDRAVAVWVSIPITFRVR